MFWSYYPGVSHDVSLEFQWIEYRPFRRVLEPREVGCNRQRDLPTINLHE